jgi:hypothetical protein
LNNYIEIKELNMKTGDVRGSFQARVISDSGHGLQMDLFLIPLTLQMEVFMEKLTGSNQLGSMTERSLLQQSIVRQHDK